MTPDAGQALETAGVVAAFLDSSMSVAALYLSTVSGYLVVAYILGSKLTRMQSIIITSLFTVVASLEILAAVNIHAAIHYYSTTYGAGRTTPWMSGAIGVVQSAGVLASLKFMWDIRHPKGKKDQS